MNIKRVGMAEKVSFPGGTTRWTTWPAQQNGCTKEYGEELIPHKHTYLLITSLKEYDELKQAFWQMQFGTCNHCNPKGVWLNRHEKTNKCLSSMRSHVRIPCRPNIQNLGATGGFARSLTSGPRKESRCVEAGLDIPLWKKKKPCNHCKIQQ